ncbi:MAG: alanine racemase [Lachnospiraceae bacterium]|nr:alanine racemase [Lachnospiraceae bacterium]
MKEYSRIYAKIDLDAVHFNIKSIIGKIAENTKIIAVIKADGYGHGAVEIAEEIEPYEKVYGFAVATADEAFILRRNGIQKPILVLGYTYEEDYEKLLRKQVCFTVYTYEMAEKIAKTAIKMQQTAKVHIKIDTGMSRIGYQVTEETAEEIVKISKLPGLEIEGMFTHFAKADETDKTATYQQLENYKKMLKLLEERNISIPIKHCSNSAGIVEIPEANMDVVRAGIILYGLWPSDEVSREAIELKPVMELKSKIIYIKTLEAGRSISYGGTYTLKEPRVIATIPVGYADGYPRSLSNTGYVLIHGKKAPIVGRVCMDQFMVDVTDIPDAKILDTVTLLGQDNGAFLGMEELGELSDRFNYEFACDIGKRIPRVFYKNNCPVFSKDYFSE